MNVIELYFVLGFIYAVHSFFISDKMTFLNPVDTIATALTLLTALTLWPIVLLIGIFKESDEPDKQ